MNTIPNIFLNALLADATYASDIIDGISGPALNSVLTKRMTPFLAKYISDNFSVVAHKESSDTVGSGFDATVWRGVNGGAFAGKVYVSIQGTTGLQDFLTRSKGPGSDFSAVPEKLDPGPFDSLIGGGGLERYYNPVTAVNGTATLLDIVDDSIVGLTARGADGTAATSADLQIANDAGNIIDAGAGNDFVFDKTNTSIGETRRSKQAGTSLQCLILARSNQRSTKRTAKQLYAVNYAGLRSAA